MSGALRVLDLFSGACGGVSLGLERAGMTTVALCEADPWRRSRLRQNWPGLPIFRDVRHVGERTTRALGRIDVVAGSPPCQDISAANHAGRGIDGARSGLFFEFTRVVAELRPAWVLAENVPRLRTRGGDWVLAELEAAGYTCWPLVVGARHVGAPHQRDRVWIVAHAERDGRREGPQEPVSASASFSGALRDDAGTAADARKHQRRPDTPVSSCHERPGEEAGLPGDGAASRRMAPDAIGAGLRQQPGRGGGPSRRAEAEPALDALPDREGQSRGAVHGQVGGGEGAESADDEPWGHWNAGPGAHLRLASGLPTGVARRQIAAFGDAVVPQVVEAIGRAIVRVAA